jgi:hypothetical protein
MKYFFEYFIHISEKDVNYHIFKINITLKFTSISNLNFQKKCTNVKSCSELK